MKEPIVEFINSELLNSQIEITAQDDLLINGPVDSLGVMRLVAFIEQKFGIVVPPEDITIDTFVNVDAIVRYLGEKAGNGHET